MSIAGEWILKRLLAVRKKVSDLKSVKQSQINHEDYIRWQYNSSKTLFKKFSNLCVAGKSVLEIGCGTGGRSAFLASQGAKRVVGIDIQHNEIDVAKKSTKGLYPELARKLEFYACGENEKLDLGTFDVVMLVDVMEHVVSPPDMMRLMHQYTKPGGQAFFSCIGYYNHAGSHMGMLPFVNLFFSDETILNTVRNEVSQPDYIPGRFDSNPPIERWRGLYDLRDRPGEYLNKLTLRKLNKLVKYSIFPYTEKTVIGFSENHNLLRPLNLLKDIPMLQEVFHSLVVVECRRGV